MSDKKTVEQQSDDMALRSYVFFDGALKGRAMTTLQNILGALAFLTFLSLANGLATNAGEYAAPTNEEIEADIQTQRIKLCNADGWPDDADSNLAFQRACVHVIPK